MATIAKKYLNFAEKSIFKPEISVTNPPKALYALMLVAVCYLLFPFDIQLTQDAILNAPLRLTYPMGFSRKISENSLMTTMRGNSRPSWDMLTRSVRDAGSLFWMVFAKKMRNMISKSEICP